MGRSLHEELNIRSVVDLSTLNIQERALAAYLNIAYFYSVDKHWKWLLPFSKELVNLPKRFYYKGSEIPELIYVDEETFHKAHQKSNLILAFSPESTEDLYNSRELPLHLIGQTIYYEDVADKILSDISLNEELHNTVIKLNRHSEFRNSIDLSPYLIKLRT